MDMNECNIVFYEKYMYYWLMYFSVNNSVISLFFFKVRWARPVASATNHLVGRMDVRWCAVAGATIPPAWNGSQSASVSLSGAAQSNARIVKRRWIYTPAKLRSEPNGWTRLEAWPLAASSNLFLKTSCEQWHSGIWSPPLVTPLPDPYSLLHGFIVTVFVKALQAKKKDKKKKTQKNCISHERLAHFAQPGTDSASLLLFHIGKELTRGH